MYKLYSNKGYRILVSEYVDIYSIVCKKEEYKINILLYKDMQNVHFKLYEDNTIIYNKMLTVYGSVKSSKELKTFILKHIYISNTVVQLMIINSIDIFYKNY